MIMALVLPAQTRELALQANVLLAEAQEQGNIVHKTALLNKEVFEELGSFISNFSVSHIIGDIASSTKTLEKTESTFDEIQEGINLISQKENDLNFLIQKFFECRQEGTAESINIQARRTEAEANLAATEAQIIETQENVTRLADEVEQLESNLANAQRQLDRRRKRRRGLIIATVLTAGIATPGLLVHEGNIANSKKVRNDRQSMLSNTQNHLQQLQASKVTSECEKAELHSAQEQLQNELIEVERVLKWLNSALRDTISYRMFLLSLSDAFKEVKVHVKHLLRNLEQVSIIHEQGISMDSACKSNLEESHRGLAESWYTAKASTAVKIVLYVVDPERVQATLTSIKALQ